MCWINEQEFVLYFHTGEDEYEPDIEGMEENKGCLLVYSIKERTYTRCIPFDGFQNNVYHECLPGAWLFFDEQKIISTCPVMGVRVISLETGAVIQELPDVHLTDFYKPGPVFVSQEEGKTTLYRFS